MATTINLPQAQTPMVSASTGVTDPTWYRFFVQLFTQVGSGQGFVQIPGFTAANLPNNAPQGSMAYVLDTRKPAWFTGTLWRYADGTEV